MLFGLVSKCLQGKERLGQYHDVVRGNASEQRDTLVWCR